MKEIFRYCLFNRRFKLSIRLSAYRVMFYIQEDEIYSLSIIYKRKACNTYRYSTSSVLM